mmetsp:Transcript_7772/g.18976  ORF Transcript_7772/g.18976 Transcript_7772/m.18976 type:complete len:130 (+) Transcript_7772:961-1350(+)
MPMVLPIIPPLHTSAVVQQHRTAAMQPRSSMTGTPSTSNEHVSLLPNSVDRRKTAAPQQLAAPNCGLAGLQLVSHQPMSHLRVLHQSAAQVQHHPHQQPHPQQQVQQTTWAPRLHHCLLPPQREQAAQS